MKTTEAIKYPVITIDKHEDILRKKSEPVDISKIGTEEFNKFLDELYKSMMAVELPEGWMHGGISAIQVGRPKRVFYAYNGNSDDYELFINPEIEFLGNAQDVKEESCLSIPEERGFVRRYKRIRISYIDREGNQQRKKYSGWNARVIQHEYDHLEGELFIDKLVETE
jgi:peptide deformylase